MCMGAGARGEIKKVYSNRKGEKDGEIYCE